MMEGISGEAASLAGHLKLNNLCWIYDNNHITIEGNTSLAFSEDVATRFLGYGWNVIARRRRQRPGDAFASLQNIPKVAATGRRLSSWTATSPTGAPNKQDTSGGPRRATGRRRDQG